MKRSRMMLALSMALLFVLAAALPAFPASKAKASGLYELVPGFSDGVTITPSSESSMSITAHESGARLYFEETKTLSFTVTYSEGWLACDRYSRFFPNDTRTSVTELQDGSFLYEFAANTGGSVTLSEWGSVRINASVSELPKLYIEASVPFAEIGKVDWVTASFTLTEGTKDFPGDGYEGTGSVKGRGNSSWGYPKKPYSIKLDSKASLLGIPKTKKYAIIPSYNDTTLMRNYITYKSYQALEGIGYVPKCEFVDVYLNGVYNGIYILVERIDIEKSKIDIEEASADNLTGGYLIEKDIGIKVDFENDLWFDCPYWANQSQDYFVMKAPEPDDEELTQAMLSYLEDHMQRVHDSIMGISGEDWHNYVDISSWIDFIIVQEVSKNIDGNFKTSCYLYKQQDDDHIYMTAPWDFDLAYGRVTWDNQSAEHNDVDDCPPANTVDGFMALNSSNPWMDRLYDTVPEFSNALKRRYTEYRTTILQDMFTMIDEQAAYLDIVQEPNYELWGFHFHNGVTILKSWLTRRLAWLDEQWLVSLDFETGDVNMDGVVDTSDALLVLRWTLGLAELDDDALELADMNGDGEVDASDALLIMRTSFGLMKGNG